MNREFDSIENIEFKGKFDELNVHSDSIKKPTIISQGDFDVKIVGKKAFITGLFDNKMDFIVPKEKQIDNMVIKTSYVNYVTINDILLQKLRISILLGDVKLTNLLLQELNVNLKEGFLHLREFDSFNTAIRMKNGNIYAEIRNIMENYNLELETLYGNLCYDSEYPPVICEDVPYKNKFIVNNRLGNVKVLFKGNKKLLK